MKTRLVVVVLCFVQLSFAQRFWQSRPWEQWKADEVNQILSNSPWTRTVTVAVSAPSSKPSRVPAAAAAMEPSGESAINYRIQLQSAATLRRAMVRRSQITNGYDDGWPHNEVLDNQLAAFLKKTFPNTVVVDVTFDSDSAGYLAEASKYWSGQDTDRLKPSAYLEEIGRASCRERV